MPQLQNLKIREIKQELKMGYISSRYYDIKEGCFCHITLNTYSNKVEIRIADELLLKDSVKEYSIQDFLKVKKQDLFKEVSEALEKLK